MIQDIDALLEEIEQRKNRGSGLTHFQDYMRMIGNPHLKLKVIHVAGTNGKGSTLNYTRSILQEAGYRVGTFSSPYLETHRDRIRINDHFISEEEFLRIANRYYDSWMEYDLSMFEIDMAIASIYFLEEGCDFCIFEVGLGGRLDLTNIVEPLVTVITNIGMDHMEQLGDTYEKIAYEKAGIIKEHVPLITAEEKRQCLQVFEESCAKHHVPMILMDPPTRVQYALDSISFCYKGMDIKISNGAHYQIKNASCAIEAILQLKKRTDAHITKEHIEKGIAKAIWKGRFETIWKDPWIILDGAHNEEGILALKETLQDFPAVHILFAALKDKDTDAMMRILLQITKHITVTQFPFYRSLNAVAVAKDFPVQIEEDFHKAIEESMQHPDTPLVITGSLYFISQVREYLMKKKKRGYIE